MSRDEIIAENTHYVRKIAIIEDWFCFLFAKKRIPYPSRFKQRILKIRMPEVPTIKEVKGMSTPQLFRIVNPLSIYAHELWSLWQELHHKRIPPCGIDRTYMRYVMYDLERGYPPYHYHPFTYKRNMRRGIFQRRFKPTAERISFSNDANDL